MNIHFEKVSHKHKNTIFSWLAEPHVQEFWDNSHEHKEDILNFISGRKYSSPYFDGLYHYWIGFADNVPYCFIMTMQEKKDYILPGVKRANLSKHGTTYSLDYLIGTKDYLGKGLGASTLVYFMDFIRESDKHADTFFIDPDEKNPRAKRVYEKAGFKYIGDFIMESGVFKGQNTNFMIKKYEPTISLIAATITDYPLIQNMARFYVYDFSRTCGFISSKWTLPEDGLYECFDLKKYIDDPDRHAFLINVDGEIAGFALVDQVVQSAESTWNMGEFFILAKFQGKGIGQKVAHQIWDLFGGAWEVSVIPENKPAYHFWQKTIRGFTNGHYKEKIWDVTFDAHQPKRIVFTFNASNQNVQLSGSEILIRPSLISDIETLVSLSKHKRLNYEKEQPQFWKYTGVHAEQTQTKWFEELLTLNDHIMLTAKQDDKIVGFIIGKLVAAPEVYNPGGLTLMIDDFCVTDESDWPTIGVKLINEIKLIAKAKGAAQIIVVSGAHDEPKRNFLKSCKLSIASEWYVGGIE